MSDPTGKVPVATGQQGEPESRDWKQRLQEMIEKLQQERDELRVKLHLGKAEARDELARLDKKLDELKGRARVARGEAGEALEDIEEAAKTLWGEIRDGYARVRKSLAE
jgi:chromosome segregation ATPase